MPSLHDLTAFKASTLKEFHAAKKIDGFGQGWLEKVIPKTAEHVRGQKSRIDFEKMAFIKDPTAIYSHSIASPLTPEGAGKYSQRYFREIYHVNFPKIVTKSFVTEIRYKP